MNSLYQYGQSIHCLHAIIRVNNKHYQIIWYQNKSIPVLKLLKKLLESDTDNIACIVKKLNYFAFQLIQID